MCSLGLGFRVLTRLTHILTSCCVGSGLRIVGMGEGAMGLYDGIDLDLKHSTDGDHNYVK